MKKLATLAALAALALPVIAAEEVVTSSNVVGYTKVQLSPGLNLLGGQFVNIGDATSRDINDLITLTNQASYDEDFDAQTELRLWTGSGYSTYEWSGNLSKENSDLAEELDAADGSLDNKFLYGYEEYETPIPAGKGFWIWASNSGTATMVGQVPTTESITINLVAGLNLVSNPWPVAAPLSKISLVGQASYDEDFDAQTELRLWTGSGYSTYEWSGALSSENPDLAEELDASDGSLDNKFLYGYEETNASVPVGTGFWVWASGAGSIVFTP